MREYLEEWEAQALAFRIAEALARTAGKTPEYVARAKENACKKASLDAARERRLVSRLLPWDDLPSEPADTSTDPADAATASDLLAATHARLRQIASDAALANTALEHLVAGFSEQESANTLGISVPRLRHLRTLIRTAAHPLFVPPM